MEELYMACNSAFGVHCVVDKEKGSACLSMKRIRDIVRAVVGICCLASFALVVIFSVLLLVLRCCGRSDEQLYPLAAFMLVLFGACVALYLVAVLLSKVLRDEEDLLPPSETKYISVLRLRCTDTTLSVDFSNDEEGTEEKTCSFDFKDIAEGYVCNGKIIFEIGCEEEFLIICIPESNNDVVKRLKEGKHCVPTANAEEEEAFYNLFEELTLHE